MAETKSDALTEVTRACMRCTSGWSVAVDGTEKIKRSPQINLGATGLECALGGPDGLMWRKPPGGCPIPRLYQKVQSDRVDPATVTREYVEARRPKHDGNGNWQKDQPEPEPEPAEEGA